MREPGVRISFLRLVVAMTFMAAAGVAAAGDYACHVQIVKDKPAIVLIDAGSSAAATDIAGRVKARAADGTRAPVVRVVQCIDRLSGRFSDAQMQQQLEKLAL